MSNETNDNRHPCAHPPCTCKVDVSHEFCSAACQMAAGSTNLDEQIVCACPHQDCRAPR